MDEMIDKSVFEADSVLQSISSKGLTLDNDVECLLTLAGDEVTASNTSRPRQVSQGSSESNTRTPINLDSNLAVPSLTGRPPITLYLSCNPDHLSPFQCLARKHLEFFEASHEDVARPTKGRNHPIILGQVGIRCRHCQAATGSRYYPHTLPAIYQAAQILIQGHWMEDGRCLAPPLLDELRQLKQTKSGPSSGKDYWAATAVECDLHHVLVCR